VCGSDVVCQQRCCEARLSTCVPVCDMQDDGKVKIGARLYLLMKRFDMCLSTYITTRLHTRSPHHQREVHVSNLITSLAQVSRPRPVHER
jgi:hypothetical protein